jgi:hypothetical protein
MDSLYEPGSAAWSPALTNETPVGLREEVTGQDRVGHSNHSEAIPAVPPVPSPSVGGQTGIARAYGWTTGLLPSLIWRLRFRGTVLIVPHDGPLPVTGPVGVSNRTGRLAVGVDALTASYLPSPQAIAQSFTRPSPLALHMEEVNQNG